MTTEPTFRNRNQQQLAQRNPHSATVEDGAFLTAAQVATLMQVSVRTVYAAIHAGRLPALNWGTGTRPCYRIDPANLAALIDPYPPF